jgi:hypothetical protein
MVNVTPALKNLDHPLYKIFADIPAGSSDFTHASVRSCEKIAFVNLYPERTSGFPKL